LGVSAAPLGQGERKRCFHGLREARSSLAAPVATFLRPVGAGGWGRGEGVMLLCRGCRVRVRGREEEGEGRGKEINYDGLW